MANHCLSRSEARLGFVLTINTVSGPGEPSTHELLLFIRELVPHRLHVSGEGGSEAVAPKLPENMKQTRVTVDGFYRKVHQSREGLVRDGSPIVIHQPGGLRGLLKPGFHLLVPDVRSHWAKGLERAIWDLGKLDTATR